MTIQKFHRFSDSSNVASRVFRSSKTGASIPLATAQLDFGHLDPIEGHFSIHRSLLDELPVILRVYVECAARLYGNPREADLIKIHLHSRKLTFHYYQDFEKSPLPELLTRIKIDLKRLFATVIDHTTGPEHQLLFFKERFLANTTRPARRWRVSPPSSANSGSARKPSATGRRRSVGDMERPPENVSRHIPGLDRIQASIKIFS